MQSESPADRYMDAYAPGHAASPLQPHLFPRMPPGVSPPGPGAPPRAAGAAPRRLPGPPGADVAAIPRLGDYAEEYRRAAACLLGHGSPAAFPPGHPLFSATGPADALRAENANLRRENAELKRQAAEGGPRNPGAPPDRPPFPGPVRL